MSSNIFSRLARMLPDAPVLVGRVLEHHDDDTSTVELPLETPSTVIGGGVARGSLIRPRGTTVPVGGWAFVRRGVIETRAPDALPLPIEVGEPPAAGGAWFLDTFAGPAGADIDSRPTDTGQSWTTPLGNPTNLLLDGAGRMTHDGAFDSGFAAFTPPSGALYMEADAQFVSSGGFSSAYSYFRIELGEAIPPNFQTVRLEIRLNSTGPGLISVHAFIDSNGGNDFVELLESTGVDGYASHVYRMESSADRLTWTVSIDGTPVGSPLLVPSLVPPVVSQVLLACSKNGNAQTALINRVQVGPL